MPARNKRATKEAAIKRDLSPEQVVVGATPKPSAPGQVNVKNLQDALVDGLEDPAQWARDFLDVDPYPEQQEFLRKSRDCIEANLTAGNRTGKTHVSGVELLWRAFYRYISPYTAPDKQSPHVSYKAVSTSLTHDQAKLAWTYAYTFSESKRFKPFVVDVVHSPFPTMKIKTRNERGEPIISEVWARSLAKEGLYLLGHSLSFVLADECAYVPNYPKIEDVVLRMRLADQGGALFRISTPNGRNFFFDYYQHGTQGDPRYYSQSIPTSANPYVSKQYLVEAKERMVPEYYAQNVLAQFVSLSDFFTLEQIQALYQNVEYTSGTTKEGIPIPASFPLEPVKGATYVMGVDLGASRDPTVVIVWRIDTAPVQTVYVGEMRNWDWRYSREYVGNLHHKYQPVCTFVDSTGNGAPIAQQLVMDDGLQGVTQFVFSHSSKPDALVKLQDAVQRRKFIFPYVPATKEMVNQMSFYRLDDKDIAQDYVMALALVNLAYEEATKVNQLDTTIYDDLAFIDVRRGGKAVSADVMGPGTLFRLDQQSGMYLPIGWTEDFDLGGGNGF